MRESAGPLLDHLIGAGEQRSRHVEPKRAGGLEVDDQVEFGGPLDGQLAGFFAFEDATCIDAGLTMRL